MYSGSRGILYTAPPSTDEADEKQTSETAATNTAASEDATEPATESTDGLPADD